MLGVRPYLLGCTEICVMDARGAQGNWGGCVAILQFWIWERFPAFRPKLLSREVLSGLNPETVPPRAFYWSARHKWVENKQSLTKYRELIDVLQDEHVNWMPYTPKIVQSLPPTCMYQQEYWLLKSPSH